MSSSNCFSLGFTLVTIASVTTVPVTASYRNRRVKVVSGISGFQRSSNFPKKLPDTEKCWRVCDARVDVILYFYWNYWNYWNYADQPVTTTRSTKSSTNSITVTTS